MNALDQIHYADNKKLRPFWRAKLVSLGLTIGVLVLIIVASMLIFISDLIVQVLADRGGALESEILKSRRVESGLLRIWRLLRWPLALGIMAAAFGFIYRYGTHRRQRGFPIFPGAMTAALLWAVLSGLFRAYVSNFGNYNRTYGAIGAVIVLLLWLYLTALVMLIGEQLNVVVGEAWHRRSLTSAQGTQDRRH
jgi:membrane protein